MNFLLLQPLSYSDLSAAVELDRRCLGGLWTENGYQREIDSPNSDLFGLYLRQPDLRQLGSKQLSSEQLFPEQPFPRQPDRVQPDTTAQLSPDQKPLTLIGLACVWAILNEAHITLLAIDASYRGQGLGQMLLYALLVSAHRRQMEWATLEVRISNQTAILLYQRFGFEQVGQRPGYYQDTGEAALILWRKDLQKPRFQICLQQWHNEIELRLCQSNYQLTTSDLGAWPKQQDQTASQDTDATEADRSSLMNGS